MTIEKRHKSFEAELQLDGRYKELFKTVVALFRHRSPDLKNDDVTRYSLLWIINYANSLLNTITYASSVSLEKGGYFLPIEAYLSNMYMVGTGRKEFVYPEDTDMAKVLEDAGLMPEIFLGSNYSEVIERLPNKESQLGEQMVIASITRESGGFSAAGLRNNLSTEFCARVDWKIPGIKGNDYYLELLLNSYLATDLLKTYLTYLIRQK